MKRPVGFTILALVLCWLALAGFGNAFVGPAQGGFRVLAMIYGIAAISSAVGLYKMSAWANTALSIWAGVMVLTMIVMQLGQYRAALPVFVGFACIVLFLLWLIIRYVKRTLNKVYLQEQ